MGLMTMRQVDYEDGKTLSLSVQHSTEPERTREKNSVNLPVKALNIGWERNRGGILINCQSLEPARYHALSDAFGLLMLLKRNLETARHALVLMGRSNSRDAVGGSEAQNYSDTE
jgi:hypothetical protein